MMWVYVLIGALVWQAITMLICIVTNEDETATIWAGVGFVGAIIVGVCTAVRNTIKLINSRRYVSLMVNTKNGKLYYCPSWRDLVSKLMEYDGAYKWADNIQNKYKPSDGWRERDCFSGCVNIRYTPIKIAKAECAIPVDKTVLKAATRAWNKQ